MRRFEFSLDRVLKIKKQLERLAELELLRARGAVETARATLAELREQLSRISEQFVASVGSTMTPSQWSSASDMTERLGESIRVSELEVAAAEQKLLAASQERCQLATEVEALVTLRQQRWDQWRQESQKADQDRLDEVGIRRWQAAREDDGTGPQTSS